MSLLDENGRVLISPSRLRAWQECPLKWKAVYVEGKRSPPTASMIFGTAIHAALETFHRSLWLKTPVTVAELETVFAETLHREANPADFPSVKVGPDLQEQANRLLEIYVERFGDEKVSAVELSLTAPLIDTDTGEDLGATLVGVIDLITESRQVVDLKSSARASDVFDLALTHGTQMDAYHWLLLHGAGFEPTGVEIRLLVRRKQPDVECYQLPHRKEFRRFLDLCRKYIAFVRSTEPVHPRVNLFCGSACPAYAACRACHGFGEVA